MATYIGIIKYEKNGELINVHPVYALVNTKEEAIKRIDDLCDLRGEEEEEREIIKHQNEPLVFNLDEGWPSVEFSVE